MERIGRYQLVRRLGQGGMAEVFLAKQEGPSDFSKTVVVKRMLSHLVDPNAANGGKYVEMFLREARVAAHLNHTNVVQLFELGQDDGAYFIAMEYIDGLTLHRLAKRAWHRKVSLPTEVIVRAIADAAQGLHHAHTLVDGDGKRSGLVHRDISPDNLMITRGGVTKVLDFGIAKHSEGTKDVTKTGELKGKIPYMSPEQIQGFPLDGRTDLFSLGVTLYWLLCGVRPFDGATELVTLKRVCESPAAPPSSINPNVPPALDDITLKLLEKNPDARYATGAALHDRLLGLLGGDGAPRAPAVQLVAEMIGAPDPEDTEETLRVVRDSGPPASSPISSSFAPTTVTVATSPVPSGEGNTRRRGALAGAFAAAMLGVVGVSLLLMNREDDVPPTPPPTLPELPIGDAVTVITVPVAPVAPVPPPPVATPPVATPPVAPIVEEIEAPVAAPKVATREIVVAGPASLTWKGIGNKRGDTRITVRASAVNIVAVDARRGSTHTIPIVNGVADFNALPKGELIVRAVPHAALFLANESIGTTPPPKPVTLPVGDYTVKLVFQDKVKTARVKVTAGAKAEIRMKMTE